MTIPVLNRISIGDREWRLRLLKGKQARLMTPQIASVVSRMFYAAIRGGVDTKQLLAFFDTDFTADAFKFTDIPLEELLKTIHFIIDNITTEQLDFINDEAMPFLLCLDLEDEKMARWWDEEAPPLETYAAVWKAIRYHLTTSFGKATREAIKKSLAVEATAKEDDSS